MRVGTFVGLRGSDGNSGWEGGRREAERGNVPGKGERFGYGIFRNILGLSRVRTWTGVTINKPHARISLRT